MISAKIEMRQQAPPAAPVCREASKATIFRRCKSKARQLSPALKCSSQISRKFLYDVPNLFLFALLPCGSLTKLVYMSDNWGADAPRKSRKTTLNLQLAGGDDGCGFPASDDGAAELGAAEEGEAILEASFENAAQGGHIGCAAEDAGRFVPPGAGWRRLDE